MNSRTSPNGVQLHDILAKSRYPTLDDPASVSRVGEKRIKPQAGVLINTVN